MHPYEIYVSKAAASRITGIPAFWFSSYSIKRDDIYVKFKEVIEGRSEIKIHVSYFINDFQETRKERGSKLGVVPHHIRNERKNGDVLDELVYWNVEGKEVPFYSVYPGEKGELICECKDYKEQEKGITEPFCKHCWAVLKFENWSYKKYLKTREMMTPF